MSSPVTRIAVTPGTSVTSYALLPFIGQGDITGPEQWVDIVLHDEEARMGLLSGNCMEIQDSVFPIVRGISGTCSWRHALTNVDLLFVLPAVPTSRYNTDIYSQTHLVTPSVRHAPDHMQIVLVGTVNDFRRFQSVNPSVSSGRLLFLDITERPVRPMSLSHTICQSFREWRMSEEKERARHLENLLSAAALKNTNTQFHVKFSANMLRNRDERPVFHMCERSTEMNDQFSICANEVQR